MSDVIEPDQPEIGVAVPAPDPEVEAQLEQIEQEFEATGMLVGILASAEEDLDRLLPAKLRLSEQGIESEMAVIDASRLPDAVREFCETARPRGLKVLIAAASPAADLAGLAAADTDLPVIGVPLRDESFGGLDDLLAAAGPPTETPVAWVAVDGAQSAGALAARIINA